MVKGSAKVKVQPGIRAQFRVQAQKMQCLLWMCLDSWPLVSPRLGLPRPTAHSPYPLAPPPRRLYGPRPPPPTPPSGLGLGPCAQRHPQWIVDPTTSHWFSQGGALGGDGAGVGGSGSPFLSSFLVRLLEGLVHPSRIQHRQTSVG